MKVNLNTAGYMTTGANVWRNTKDNVSSQIYLPPLPEGVSASSSLYAEFSESGSWAVFRSDDFDESNPSYTIRGVAHGKEFEEEIFINDVNVTRASMLEIAALQVHLVQTGKISKVELGMFSIGEGGQHVERSFFEKVNSLDLIQTMYANNMALSNYRVTQYLDKIIYEMSKFK